MTKSVGSWIPLEPEECCTGTGSISWSLVQMYMISSFYLSCGKLDPAVSLTPAGSHHWRPAGRLSLDQHSWWLRIMRLPHQHPPGFLLAWPMKLPQTRTSLNYETTMSIKMSYLMSDENCSYRTQILHVYIDIDVIYSAFILPSGKLTVRYWSRGYVKIVVLPIKNGDFQYQLCNNWPQGIKLSIISMMPSWWNLKYHLSSPVVKGVHPNPTTNQPTNGKRTSYSPVFDAPHHIHQYLMPLARLQLLQIFCSKGLPIGAFFFWEKNPPETTVFYHKIMGKSTWNHGFYHQIWRFPVKP